MEQIPADACAALSAAPGRNLEGSHAGSEAMVLREEHSDQELRLRLRREFKDLLKPIKVKDLEITHANRYAVRGVVLTVCPIERTESGKDFEVGLSQNREGAISYVLVDGKRLFPSRAKRESSKTTKQRTRQM